jgi:hypothetical protein
LNPLSFWENIQRHWQRLNAPIQWHVTETRNQPSRVKFNVEIAQGTSTMTEKVRSIDQKGLKSGFNEIDIITHSASSRARERRKGVGIGCSARS